MNEQEGNWCKEWRKEWIRKREWIGLKNEWGLEKGIDEWLRSDVTNIGRIDEWRKSEMMYETNTYPVM